MSDTFQLHLTTVLALMQICGNRHVILARTQDDRAGRADTCVVVAAGAPRRHWEVLQRLQGGALLRPQKSQVLAACRLAKTRR